MNNAPFSIGQKVVYINAVNGFFLDGTPPLEKGHVATVIDLDYGYSFYENGWFIEIDSHPDFLYTADDFAPIETQYADATSEILEKFPVEDGGRTEKIKTPKTETA